MSENFKDPAWLEEQYINLKRPVSDIAKECESDEYAVNFYLEMYGFQIQD